MRTELEEDWRARLLAPFKREETPEPVLAMVDMEVARLVAAWPSCGVVWSSKPRGRPQDDLAKRWAWLWSSAEVRIESILEATGLSRLGADRAFRVAYLNRLVYPDGSVSDPARAFIRHTLRAAMKVKPGGGR